ncbi:FAD binding domain-containing protein [Candidatus Uabimicrobium sp. HlEnr_7]|uniref:FAD binding domain-containing protein n=1 Tax=Candidatus Uabimicrobium helgolandensis TaxID=3095367 RepID=UPI0035575623
MWTSVQNIEQPATLLEASKLNNSEHSTLFSGGTYLVAQKNKSIHTIIDINHLVENKIEEKEETISIGAGVTLQQIAEHFAKSVIGRCAQQSCYSKNIRNQRTIGGEIAQQSSTSDINVLLRTINVNLKVFVEDQLIDVSICEWNGKGIISEITFAKDANIDLKRYAVIPSAPPFVIVGYNYTTKNCIVGGRTDRFATFVVDKNEQVDKALEGCFTDDHNGSIKYKIHVVKVALNDFTEGTP